MQNEFRQPIEHGKCESCGREAHLFEDSLVNGNGKLCKPCFTATVGETLGEPCESCGRWDKLANGWQWMDQSEERYMYSQVFDEQDLAIRFPDYWMPIKLCRECGAPQQNAADSIQRDSSERPDRHRAVILDKFRDRDAMHSLGLIIVKDILESAGYGVLRAGIEDRHPELLDIQVPDPNESLTRLRSNPDLLVIERETASAYRVEVKTTMLSPSNYKLATEEVEKLRTHHKDAILLIYHIPNSQIWVKRVRDINWDALPIVMQEEVPYYQLPLTGVGVPDFETIEYRFPKVTIELIEDRRRIMSHLFKEYSNGLEPDSDSTFFTT